MADDLTDALRAIIEPMRGELLTALQAHKLMAIRGELGDIVLHAERAMTLISDLLREDTESPLEESPSGLAAWYRKTMANAPAKAYTPEKERRREPKAGEIWTFQDPESKDLFAALILASTTNGNPETARTRNGSIIRFSGVGDPMPVAKMRVALGDEARIADTY